MDEIDLRIEEAQRICEEIGAKDFDSAIRQLEGKNAQN